MYTIIRDPSGRVISITRQSDGAQIPLDPTNRDYRDFAAWNQAQPAPDDLKTHTPADWPGWGAYLENQHPERKTLRQQAAQALADNDAFLALGAPAAAQMLAQLRALTRQCSALIRRLVQID